MTNILKYLSVVGSHRHATGHGGGQRSFVGVRSLLPPRVSQVTGLVEDAFTHCCPLLSRHPLYVCWLHPWLPPDPEERLAGFLVHA